MVISSVHLNDRRSDVYLCGLLDMKAMGMLERRLNAEQRTLENVIWIPDPILQCPGTQTPSFITTVFHHLVCRVGKDIWVTSIKNGEGRAAEELFASSAKLNLETCKG